MTTLEKICDFRSNDQPRSTPMSVSGKEQKSRLGTRGGSGSSQPWSALQAIPKASEMLPKNWLALCSEESEGVGAGGERSCVG